MLNKNLKIRHKEKRRTISFSRLVFYILCFLFFINLIYIFFYSSFLKISEISISGNQKIDINLIQTQIKNYISSKNRLKINKNNFFFFNTNELQKIILENFPKIKTAEIKKIFPNKLEVNLTEFDLIPILCLKSQEDQCFVLEKNGKLLEKADFNSPKLQENEKVVIIDENGDDIVEIGKEFISAEKLNNIIFLGRELTYILNTKIEQPYIIPARGADEVKFKTKEGWFILLDTNRDPNLTFEFLTLFFEKELKDKKRYNLKYIDAKINEKIFYVIKTEDDDKKDEDEEEKDEIKQ